MADQTNYKCKNNSDNIQNNNPYKKNLLSALNNLTDGSTTAIVGDKPNQAAAVALCAGYLNPKDCLSCVRTLTSQLLQKCPNIKGAAGWMTTYCILRYGEYVEKKYDLWFIEPQFSKFKAKDVQRLEIALPTLVSRLSNELYKGKGGPIYAYGNLTYGSTSQTVHMVLQCTVDTLPNDCKNCVSRLHEEIKKCCSGTIDVSVFSPHCFMSLQWRWSGSDYGGGGGGSGGGAAASQVEMVEMMQVVTWRWWQQCRWSGGDGSVVDEIIS
ncbi:putative cysteine-rich repeat secretory protein 21 [Bidens hawaiensis]|uniref:putative cysteine-rich repeat secretory protein 21 n=1 Tax=Bidens hawaiensis TaxID=980011 RepID=UPI00404A4BF7